MPAEETWWLKKLISETPKIHFGRCNIIPPDDKALENTAKIFGLLVSVLCCLPGYRPDKQMRTMHHVGCYPTSVGGSGRIFQAKRNSQRLKGVIIAVLLMSSLATVFDNSPNEVDFGEYGRSWEIPVEITDMCDWTAVTYTSCIEPPEISTRTPSSVRFRNHM